jgi:hypothetical protein
MSEAKAQGKSSRISQSAAVVVRGLTLAYERSVTPPNRAHYVFELAQPANPGPSSSPRPDRDACDLMTQSHQSQDLYDARSLAQPAHHLQLLTHPQAMSPLWVDQWPRIQPRACSSEQIVQPSPWP